MSVTISEVSRASLTAIGKRKRAVVNYAELSDMMDLDMDENEAEEEQDVSDNDVPEGDSVYGSRKNATKQKAKKRTRFTKPRPKKPEKAFRFLDLPPELRDYIYELALVEPEGVTVVSKTKAYRRTVGRGLIYASNENSHWYNRRYSRRSQTETIPQSTDLSPNLLAVCKQMRAEGIGYLYKQHIMLADTMSLHAFLAAIGPTNRLQLSHISVREWGNGRGTHKAMNFASLTLLADCTNLKKLNLDCNIGWLRQPKQLARQIFRDGHYFLEAYGAANGSKDAALEILELGDGNYDENRSYYWRQQGIPKREEFEGQFDAEMRKLLGC